MISSLELDERIAKCQKILDVDPNSQIFAALAESYRKKGELDKAFRICQNGLKIHPSYGSAHVVMAKINLDRGLYDWAEIEAGKASELDGKTRSIDLLLAEIYIYKGEFDSAIELLKGLHETDPSNSQIKKLLDIARRLPEEQSRLTGVPSTVEEPSGGEPEVPIGPPEQPAEQENLSAAEIVGRAAELPGVEGALFVNLDGLVAEQDWHARMDPATCGAAFSDLGKELQDQLLNGSFGCMKTLLIETEGPIFHVVRVVDGAFLFVAGGQTNLGSLRMKVEKLLGMYRHET